MQPSKKPFWPQFFLKNSCFSVAVAFVTVLDVAFVAVEAVVSVADVISIDFFC